MKKIKALSLISTLFSLSLVSCSGGNNYYGTYQFQMGKANASHIGIYMDLTKELIDVTIDGEVTKMEKFSLTFSAPESTEEGDSQTSLGILSAFGNGLIGGYKIAYDETLESNHVTLAPVLDLSSLLSGVLGDVGIDDALEETSDSSSSKKGEIVIPSSYVDRILLATYSSNNITVTVPVSLTDLMFQLYWYGLDIFDPLNMDLPKHDLSTHPTAEDIKTINETYNATHTHYNIDELIKYQSFTTVDYRDFNQLTMSLAKADKK